MKVKPEILARFFLSHRGVALLRKQLEAIAARMELEGQPMEDIDVG